MTKKNFKKQKRFSKPPASSSDTRASVLSSVHNVSQPDPSTLPAEVSIDGSQHEGGGQMVRATVALSSIMSKSSYIHKIRYNRQNPGLSLQHLRGAELVSFLSGSTLSGGFIRSRSLHLQSPENNSPPSEITFPVDVQIGSAGSVTLVLQAALPCAVLRMKGELDQFVIISGGTDVQLAPVVSYYQYVLAPNLEKFGIHLHIHVHKRGFFPVGGGKISMTLQKEKCEDGKELMLKPWNVATRAQVERFIVVLVPSNFATLMMVERAQRHILKLLKNYLLDTRILNAEDGDSPDQFVEVVVEDASPDVRAQTMSITIVAVLCDGTRLGASDTLHEREVFGNKSKRTSNKDKRPRKDAVPGEELLGIAAEELADVLTSRLLSNLSSFAHVDEHMADQLLVFMAMASGTSQVIAPRKTEHIESMIAVLAAFGVDVHGEHVEQSECYKITCHGKGIPLEP